MSLFDDKDIQKWVTGMPQPFSEWLEQEIYKVLSRLRVSSDLLEMGRCQGRLEYLYLIKQLKEES